MKFFIYSLSLLFSLNSFAEFDKKCSVLITKRLQTSEDAYKDAINKINQCDQYDILSVTSFLEETISKVYITDLIQTYCMFVIKSLPCLIKIQAILVVFTEALVGQKENFKT